MMCSKYSVPFINKYFENDISITFSTTTNLKSSTLRTVEVFKDQFISLPVLALLDGMHKSSIDLVRTTTNIKDGNSNILIWAINFTIQSTTRRFTISNTIMENENTSFANISIPFLRSCSKGIEILAKVFNIMRFLVILFITKMESFATVLTINYCCKTLHLSQRGPGYLFT